ncbi:uncharacterized protein LOC124915723 [Impatiens glandulifera]|uniref:uncharacterized protein LOC124915723 n=1 Tax=Impatiens glandulifera TaxID=253017 RepID=UPI001FB051FE|nr:uncharacterized protein LOC124915723 [Impatiens glandulifera]
MKMKPTMSIYSLITILLLCSSLVSTMAAQTVEESLATKMKKKKGSSSSSQPKRRDSVTCYNRRSKCFLKHITCPNECPEIKPKYSNSKACFLDCYSPKCEAVCRMRKPNCNGSGAACYDPRFIGGDGIVFYFHGKSNQHFALVSDTNLQINARFIGHRPAGRTRDFTWIQSLGIVLGTHSFTLEATKAEKWTDEVDHLRLTYDGYPLTLPEGHYSKWGSRSSSGNGMIRVERTSRRNSVLVILRDVAEIFVNVVPITEEDNLVHNYQIPNNDSFAHLEVQFRFIELSPEVEGILGRTYRPDFKNPAKVGVEMPVVGGDEEYRTSSILSPDCKNCVFSIGKSNLSAPKIPMEFGTIDCTKMDGCRK